MNVWKKTCLILLLACSSWSVSARDSVCFSLLTCSPGEEIYELFGHTAVRYRNITTGEDLTINYGIFDFDTPNFILRFVRGETDYMMGITPFRYFINSYALRGSSVFEQQLDLSTEEANKLDSLFRVNYLPSNRMYRYNYFYDNCTTRARDRIEEVLTDSLFYSKIETGTTYRQWVKRCTEGHPWADFGINLCLGSEADKPLNNRQQMFLPMNLQKAFSQAVVLRDSTRHNLVLNEKFLLSPIYEDNTPQEGFELSPMQTAWGLFLVVLLLSILEWRRRSVWWGIDLLLFSLQGVAGCLIAFLFFCSVHPTVDSNYLLIILNPLPLFFLPTMLYRIRKGKKDPYDVANLIVLTLFIAFLPVIPQKISLVIVPLALILWIRSLLHLIVARAKVSDRQKK